MALLMEGVVPHVGVEAEGEQDRALIAKIIAQGMPDSQALLH